jgi:1,4-dihydroxy-2-naphthoyl-CoA hydrolase
MHFHQLLRWCHEAYEESLERFGITAGEIFPAPGRTPAVALPIVHCQADFRRPLFCGDQLSISLQLRQVDPGSFEVTYRFDCGGQLAAHGLTRHRAITVADRQGCALPAAISSWLEASGASG